MPRYKGTPARSTPLAQFLTGRGQRARLAERLEIQRGRVWAYETGRTVPTEGMRRLIEIATDGAVAADDWFEDVADG